MTPLSIVVVGATGDLFKKKLVEALFSCFCKGKLGEKFSIIGISRKFLSHAEFREVTRSILLKNKEFEEFGESFLGRLFYYSLDATDEHSFYEIRSILDKNDLEFKECSNKLFYIATAPDVYENIFLNIKKSGASVPCAIGRQNNSAWARIIMEKPFGNDSKNAERLDAVLSESFEENQIFRIDHYLAKETVQNIYTFRFKNTLFSPLWSKNYIEKIEIRCFEDEKKDTISARQVFYDKVGALKDFGQNHLLELLSLIAMEEPDEDTPKEIRRKRAEVLADTFFDFKNPEDLKIGQYEGYAIGDFMYSKTETYFKAKLFVKNERWKNIPFFLEHGKALNETKSEIIVHFKKEKNESPNTIHFNIQPEAEICVEMNTEEGDSEDKKRKKQMCFDLGVKENQFIYPYEKLLQDAILGDQTLFVSSAEVKEEWRIAEGIQNSFKDVELKMYKKGSDPELI